MMIAQGEVDLVQSGAIQNAQALLVEIERSSGSCPALLDNPLCVGVIVLYKTKITHRVLNQNDDRVGQKPPNHTQ